MKTKMMISSTLLQRNISDPRKQTNEKLDIVNIFGF
jgi:hypothetical protein